MREYSKEELEKLSVEELEELLASLEEEEEEEEEVAPPRKRVARAKPVNNHIESGTATRREKISTGPRPNKFLTSDISGLHKQDHEIDEKLWKGRQPVSRGDRVSDVIEIECYECGEPVLIASNLAIPDGRVKCNKCTKR